ncbi:hypothetical protein FQ085_00725 [Planococcus sp. ANT_H30]|uniref:hypothetical protein n=1 Tax=Planococcus sp. ANT_H30 TaxID=2597347 RepID=UPI0011F095F2|nr:hypothetical protein [Planococcus sp. ANT_H30]KAA0958269.1 hypothetical protein FQ085_00725 [Planococcus sp. ANT_H30]
MSVITYQTEQRYNQLLMVDYKELVKSFEVLKSSAKKMYDVGIEEKWNHIDELDDISITINSKENHIFIKYNTSKRKQIDIKLQQNQSLKEEKIKKLFEIKSKRIKRHLDCLGENSLGTTLNLLEEFYNNVYKDIERNSIKASEFELSFNRISTYKLNTEILKFDDNTEKKINIKDPYMIR